MRDSHVQTAQTPITHVIVLFQENVPFDHYFGTYPKRAEQRRGAKRAERGREIERGGAANF